VGTELSTSLSLHTLTSHPNHQANLVTRQHLKL